MSTDSPPPLFVKPIEASIDTPAGPNRAPVAAIVVFVPSLVASFALDNRGVTFRTNSALHGVVPGSIRRRYPSSCSVCAFALELVIDAWQC